MSTLQIRFTASISQTSIARLCSAIYSVPPPSVEQIVLSIGSPGGNIMAAVSAVTLLTSHSAEVHTHAIGPVESAANVLFAAGSRRTCVAAARFLYHDVTWEQHGTVTPAHLAAVASLALDDRRLMAGVLARSRSATSEEIEADMVASRIIDSSGALALGIVHEIVESPFDPQLGIVQVSDTQ